MAREVSPRQAVPSPKLDQYRAKVGRLEALRQLVESPGWQLVQADLDRMAKAAQAQVERPPDGVEQATTRYWNLGYAMAMKNVAQYVPLAIQMSQLTEEEREQLARG